MKLWHERKHYLRDDYDDPDDLPGEHRMPSGWYIAPMLCLIGLLVLAAIA